MPGYENFYKTAEGKAYYQGERQYAVDLRADGTFRIEDVPAGQYELKLHFRGRTNPDEGGLHAAGPLQGHRARDPRWPER